MESQLLAILRIGHDTSARGAGISLREALERTQYLAIRGSFGPIDLLALIKGHPALIGEWISYSEDKRTSGGWYLTKQGEVGMVGSAKERKLFDSLEVAVAEYVVRELDFWAGLSPSVDAP